MTYWCSGCKTAVDDEDLVPVYQWDGEGVMGGYHVVECKCPHCGGTDLVEAWECSECHEYYDRDDMISTDNGLYCYECAKRIHEEFIEKWE